MKPSRRMNASGPDGTGDAFSTCTMPRRLADAHFVPFPAYRRFAAVAYWSVRHKPAIHGLIEVDVTDARRRLRKHRERTGESLSFTAFLSSCVAKAVDEDKSVQAFRCGRSLAIFDDVDVCVRIERDLAGQKCVVPYILRRANHKTVRELHAEIRAAQAAPGSPTPRWLDLLPSVLYRPLLRGFVAAAAWNPRLWKETAGTVGVTSVGMFANGAGWGIPTVFPNAMMVTLGGIGERPALVDGKAIAREVLSLTVTVDHDLVDGAPAARFTERLKELVESGFGLDELNDEPRSAP